MSGSWRGCSGVAVVVLLGGFFERSCGFACLGVGGVDDFEALRLSCFDFCGDPFAGLGGRDEVDPEGFALSLFGPDAVVEGCAGADGGGGGGEEDEGVGFEGVEVDFGDEGGVWGLGGGGCEVEEVVAEGRDLERS